MKLDIKIIGLAGGLAANLFISGWFVGDILHRLATLEREDVVVKVKMDTASEERREIINRLFMIDRLGDDLQRIKSDIQELKESLK